MRARIPDSGRPWRELYAEMEAMREHDLDWRRGRHGAYVWYANEELETVLREAYGMFMTENGLGIRVFPSIARMEQEVLEIVSGLLDGGDDTAGIFTSGGTESIFLAISAMREWGRAIKPGVARPRIVAPHSAHPALNKAAHYLGMEVDRVPTGQDFRADPALIAAAITPETIGVYASAPSYSLGMVDPIGALGELAHEHGLWFHVDACVGGVLGGFVRELGRPVPSFGFGNAGVTSVSADLHKSGYAAKPASTVTFRSREMREYARYKFSDWPSGMYSSYTFTGSRPGGAIAAAWAAMHFLGREGYRELAASSMRARDRMAAGLQAMPGVSIHGAPDLWAFAWAAEGVDMASVAGALYARGWVAGTTTHPPGIHVMATPVHEAFADDYVDVVKEALREVGAGEAPVAGRSGYN